MFADSTELGDPLIKLAYMYQQVIMEQKRSLQKMQETLNVLVEEKTPKNEPAKIRKRK